MFWSMIPAMVAVQSAIAAQQAAAHHANRQQYAAHRAAGLNNLRNLLPRPCEYCQHPGHSKLCTQCGAPRGLAAAVEVCTRCGGAHALSRCRWPI